MYNKIYADEDVLLLGTGQYIRKLASNSLNEQVINLLIDAYYYQFRNIYSFNHEHFLLDLKSYLKYLEVYSPLPYSLRNVKVPFKFSLYYKQKCFSPLSRYQNYKKKVYLDHSTNKIVRLHSSKLLEFLWQRLMGLSEASISKSVKNNLLVASCDNIPGEAIDVVERVVPLDNLFRNPFYQNIPTNLLQGLKESQETNILITDFSKYILADSGLVVRYDKKNNKRVYVAAFNLKFRYSYAKDFRKIIFRLNQQCYNLNPHSLSYEELIEFIPQLAELTPQFSPIIK